MNTRLEVRLSQDHHDKINRMGGEKLTREDNGGLLFIVPGGVFDGELWCHEVLQSQDAPLQ